VEVAFKVLSNVAVITTSPITSLQYLLFELFALVI